MQLSVTEFLFGSCRPVPEGYTKLTEGKASILQKGNDVFYNPAQVQSSEY